MAALRTGLQLNIGSGVHHAPGWINIDSNDLDEWEVDLVASALDLPYDDNLADRCYFGHVLEHLSYEEHAPTALREAHRVLHEGGELGVVGPAMDLAIATGQPESLLEAIRQDPPDESGLGHAWEANVANTLGLVRSVFPDAKQIPVAEMCRRTGWPNTVLDTWQVAILAVK